MSNSKTLKKNTKPKSEPVSEDFNSWLDIGTSLTPITLSPERIQQLDTPPYAIMDERDGTIWLHPKTAQDVADMMLLARQRGYSISLNAKRVGTHHFDLSQLKRVRDIHFKDTAITVETGMLWGEFQRHLGQYKRWVPLSYPPKLTLLEVLANDLPSLDTGNSNYPGGYPRDFVMGIELATTDGRLNRYGGLVVKNATGYDLNKLYTGSQHEFGIITSVTLKLFPKPIVRHAFRIPFSSPQQVWPLLDYLKKSSLPLQWLELVLCLNNPAKSALIVQLVSHYQDLANYHQQQLKQLIYQANLPLEPVETDTIHLLLPTHHSYTQIPMAYSSTVDQANQVLKNEVYWFNIIQQCLKGCLPDWITFSPMARMGTLIWEDPLRLSTNTEQKVDALLALHAQLHGQNPYGVPEGFLDIKGFESNSTYLHDVLKSIYDPTSVLT